ncbi:MAG: hypothetical protein L0Z48_12400 [candidate division Zixibacteria bacterium]|nr:hypothetical protein [candidate division Zixibacteria bacterium]MCI0597323.1 hypothetical protein [candidate division Zixibacteria bacterium]
MQTLRIFKILAAGTMLQLLGATQIEAGFWSSYPRDGRFKQLPARADMWYYVDDEHWAIRAPDKWQHYIGCYVSQRLLQQKIGKWKAFLVIESLGILKEIDDGYREGWSPRDLIVDNLGILGALVSGDRLKFTGSYDTEKFTIRAHYIF